jgi:hypothetical protein
MLFKLFVFIPITMAHYDRSIREHVVALVEKGWFSASAAVNAW